MTQSRKPYIGKDQFHGTILTPSRIKPWYVKEWGHGIEWFRTWEAAIDYATTRAYERKVIGG